MVPTLYIKDIVEGVQRKATKLVKGMEGLHYDESIGSSRVWI